MTTFDDQSAEEPLAWSVHPARERPVALCLVLAVIVALAWLSAVLMEGWSWGVFAAAVPLAMLQRFFFPSQYRIDANGVEARHALSSARLPWDQVRRFVYDSMGGYLSSRSRPSALDSLRGIHLLFAGNADEVIARVRRGQRESEAPAEADQREGEAPAEPGQPEIHASHL